MIYNDDCISFKTIIIDIPVTRANKEQFKEALTTIVGELFLSKSINEVNVPIYEKRRIVENDVLVDIEIHHIFKFNMSEEILILAGYETKKYSVILKEIE